MPGPVRQLTRTRLRHQTEQTQEERRKRRARKMRVVGEDEWEDVVMEGVATAGAAGAAAARGEGKDAGAEAPHVHAHLSHQQRVDRVRWQAARYLFACAAKALVHCEVKDETQELLARQGYMELSRQRDLAFAARRRVFGLMRRRGLAAEKLSRKGELRPITLGIKGGSPMEDGSFIDDEAAHAYDDYTKAWGGGWEREEVERRKRERKAFAGSMRGTTGRPLTLVWKGRFGLERRLLMSHMRAVFLFDVEEGHLVNEHHSAKKRRGGAAKLVSAREKKRQNPALNNTAPISDVESKEAGTQQKAASEVDDDDDDDDDAASSESSESRPTTAAEEERQERLQRKVVLDFDERSLTLIFETHAAARRVAEAMDAFLTERETVTEYRLSFTS